MDLTPATKSPEAKPLSFSNGALKRHNNHHFAAAVTYKQCLKNHAASIGGHALDGCGEFMPSPNATLTDPASFKCAACGCHRNFHRREPDDSPPPPTATVEYQPHHRHQPPPPHPHRSPNSASPPPISSAYPSAPHMLMALSGGASRKRFRTKFSQNQKDRMYEFAERVGWKMQKRDDDIVQEFCNQIGINKGVLKVWMHNNKNAFFKRDSIANGNGSKSHSGDSDNLNNNHRHFDSDNVGHVGTNGSSSSS